MAIDTAKLTIASAARHLKAGDFSARELAEAYLENIEKENPRLNAYLEVFKDACEQADAADKLRAEEEENTPTLAGIPLAIKDNMLIEGRRVSCASRILENYTASYDATVISKLKKARAVFLGRANMDEFAMGSSTENSAFGVTKNPPDDTRVPGGSSGGSAAAVAGELALAALGSDTGGSIRQPAAFCGVVGMKPTYGAVSRSGLVAMASSLDQIGPLAKTVEDARLLFEVIRGYDPKDSTSLSDYDTNETDTEKKYTIGVPDFLDEKMEGMDDAAYQNFRGSLSLLEKSGHKIERVQLPNLEAAMAAYYIIMPAEVSTNLARFDGMRYGLHKDGANLFDDYTKTRGAGFGEEARRRILLGTYVLSAGYYDAFYNKAVEVRSVITESLKKAFEHVDVIATPTTPTPAFKIGEKADDPLAMYLSDIFTVPANIAGIPALSVPSGMVEYEGTNLPLGLQFLAPHQGEGVLFAAGEAFEQLRGKMIAL